MASGALAQGIDTMHACYARLHLGDVCWGRNVTLLWYHDIHMVIVLVINSRQANQTRRISFFYTSYTHYHTCVMFIMKSKNT